LWSAGSWRRVTVTQRRPLLAPGRGDAGSDKCCVWLSLRTMSKGHGKLQRRLLEILDASRAFETFELTAQVFAVRPDEHGRIIVTATQVVAVRRALQKLAHEGVIYDLGYGGRRKVWANERLGLRVKIRMLQEQNARDRDAGKMDFADFKRRVAAMTPLTKRAEELGVDYWSGWE
jgi:hypothetical protein